MDPIRDAVKQAASAIKEYCRPTPPPRPAAAPAQDAFAAPKRAGPLNSHPPFPEPQRPKKD